MAVSGSSMTARNHPYRLEVQDITPVSASILWSLRPPPLSAIPRNFLRQQKQHLPIQHHHQATLSNGSSTSSSSQPSRSPMNRLANEQGVTATRSVNRKVTKVTMRNISPNKRNRLAKQSQTPSQGIESEDWPSDDGATAVDEEEAREEDDADHGRAFDEDPARLHQEDYSEASDDGIASAKIFDAGVCVCVNGVPWSQVVMGDRGSDEAFIVVYGLLPAREYELLLTVEGKQQSATLALSTAAAVEREEKPASNVAVPATINEQSRSTPASAPSIQTSEDLRTHTPPMQDTDASPIEAPIDHNGAQANASAATSVSAAALSTLAIQASLRRARKDASRAESALRSEIEAIKRGLERMSDVDHRSKQKVLALQESIRQATLHAKDIDEEATAVESEREVWEEREREKEEELSKVKETVEERLREGDAKIRKDEEEIEAVEKELQKATRAMEEKWSAKEKLDRDTVTELEQELQRVQLEIKTLLQPQPVQQPNYAHYYNMPVLGQTATSSTSFVPPQIAANRGKGRGGVMRGGNRATSNPTATGPHRRNPNRQRGHGQATQSNNSDEPVYDFHGSSSSTLGSILNPNNPEFVPASVSPIVAKSTMPPLHSEYSPSVNNSRFAFSSTPLYNVDHDPERRSSLGNLNISPRANSSTAHVAAATTPWSNNASTAPVSTSPWANSNLTSSPTPAYDIWGAPTNSSATSNSIATAVPSSLHSPSSGLHTKTSIPFGLNASLLRGGTTSQSPSFARAENGPLPSFLNQPFHDETSPSQSGGSAPVSPTPSYPSKSFASMAGGPSPQSEE